MRIGITDCLREDKLQQYLDWIGGIDSTVDFLRLSSSEGNASAVEDLDGLVLTGGGDVDPDFFGCGLLRDRARDINIERDRFEFGVIQKALEREIPILGICRGMQLVNVALGGTLHVDLMSDGFNEHSSSVNGGLRHTVAIEPNSLLSGLAGGIQQTVNSYHHQAVDELGRGLMPVAKSPDGVVEAAEWSLKEGMPFVLLVQWHPERMAGTNDLFSIHIAKIFLREAQYSTMNKALHNNRG